jgi:hypothetical protein
MYGLVEHEVLRQRRMNIRHEVAAYRLEGELRSGRGKEHRFLRKLRRRLAGYAGLFGKRLRDPDGYQAAQNGGGPLS